MKTLKDIIHQSIKGNAAAQRNLYDRYKAKWFMLCLRYGKNRYEAEEIMQEGLIQIYNSLDTFDEQKSAFLTWSNRVIVYTALKFHKKNNWYKTISDLDKAEHLYSEKNTIYDQLAAKELTALIQQLPLGYRLVFNMYVMEEYTHKEIAKKLGIEVGTSKSQLYKAKRELRKILEKQFTEH